jgi:hypothetical protein
VTPFDGRHRFVQIVGTLTVEARYVPLAGAGTPQDEVLARAVAPADSALPDQNLLGRTTLGPSGLREAYRSGFMGTHYTVEIVPRPDVRVTDGAVVLSATFVDELTGRRHEAWRVVRARP